MNQEKTAVIKMVLLVPTLECGGSEKYVSLFCNTIDSNRFAVTLAVLNNAHPFYTITNKAVTVVDLKVKHVRNSVLKIAALVKQVQPDIIFSAANHLNIYLAFFRNKFSKNIILVARESSVVSINSKRAKFPFLYNLLLKKYYNRFDCIICQSAFMQQDLINKYNIAKEKTVVIHNPVQENVLPVALPPVPHQPIKLITVARLSAEKGIDRLIRSVANLSMPFEYHIIGEGDQRQVLQNLINRLQLQNKVFLHGAKSTPFAGMEDADLFLMGSHYEGFPNTLLEAGILGIPVVAFDVPGGIAEIISNGSNGFLVKNGDEKQFVLTIEKAIQTRFNRQQISTATGHTFSLQQIIARTENLFVQLMDLK